MRRCCTEQQHLPAGAVRESFILLAGDIAHEPGTFRAHEGVASALFQLGRYQEAAVHAQTISDRSLYSACFWELRSAWLREHIQAIVLLSIGLIVALAVLHRVRKKHDFLLPLKRAWTESKRKHPMLGRLIDDPLYQIRHPIDGVYYLKFSGAAALARRPCCTVWRLRLLLCRAEHRLCSAAVLAYSSRFGSLSFWYDRVFVVAASHQLDQRRQGTLASFIASVFAIGFHSVLAVLAG